MSGAYWEFMDNFILARKVLITRLPFSWEDFSSAMNSMELMDFDYRAYFNRNTGIMELYVRKGMVELGQAALTRYMLDI